MADKVMRFRLLKNCGDHFELNPNYDPEKGESDNNLREIKYSPGDIVRSTRDLTEVFRGKFERVYETGDKEIMSPEEKSTSGSSQEQPNPLDDDDEDENVSDEETSKKKKSKK